VRFETHKYKLILISIILIGLTIFVFFDISGSGLNGKQELSYGTNPFLADTSGNGLTDYEEIYVHNTDPFEYDTNNNQISDYDEVNKYGTDPTLNDTTGDGLTDYDEIYKYGTDPTTKDTTGDGLKDYDEIYKYETDPTTKDTTGDGLTDYDEIYKYGTDPLEYDTNNNQISDYDEVNKYGTDPTLNDTTGDGLKDYDEIYKYGTDPTTKDTTGDGLTDYDEIYKYETDPTTKDTTGDGLMDYDEIYKYETDPTTKDTTGDGLTDYDEIYKYETDPTTKDTLNNGLTDAFSIKEYNINPSEDKNIAEDVSVMPFEHNQIHDSYPLESISGPMSGIDSSGDGFYDELSESNLYLQKEGIDIFIEISYMEDVNIPKSTLLNIQKAFSNAPIKNSDGEESGINIHYIINEEPVSKLDSLSLNSFNNNRDNYFKYDNKGVYHLLFAHEVTIDDSRVGGFATVQNDDMVVSTEGNYRHIGATTMHEIGHKVGLWPGDYVGIDSTEISFEDYPSVMNYNYLSECQTNIENCYNFSEDSDTFNDWKHIEENYNNNHPSMYRLY